MLFLGSNGVADLSYDASLSSINYLFILASDRYDQAFMTLAFDRNRFRTYLWIGAVFFGLSLMRDLFTSPETFLKRIVNNAWLLSYLVVLNYVFLENVIAYFRLNFQRIVIGCVLVLFFMLLYSFGFYWWRGIGIRLHLYFPLKEYETSMKGVAAHFPYAFFSIFFFAIARHVHDYLQLKEATQRLRIEKQEAELNYLKSQTNPHFLFNTLNNIYSLARDKSDLAPESILRLSKILRYMLYETGGDFIAIEQELKIMNDYIELEKLRYDDSLRVKFSQDVEDMKQAVPPLLLIPLVENAFKHGVSETRNEPFVDIHLSINKRMLTFVVKNSTGVSADDPLKEKIGLSNLRRQLALLFTDYNLEVQAREQGFTATLKINLASHV